MPGSWAAGACTPRAGLPVPPACCTTSDAFPPPFPRLSHAFLTRFSAAPQAEDLVELTKELQLLHVTKEFQQAAKNGAVRDVSKDIAMLHKLIANKHETHAKKVRGAAGGV